MSSPVQKIRIRRSTGGQVQPKMGCSGEASMSRCQLSRFTGVTEQAKCESGETSRETEEKEERYVAGVSLAASEPGRTLTVGVRWAMGKR